MAVDSLDVLLVRRKELVCGDAEHHRDAGKHPQRDVLAPFDPLVVLGCRAESFRHLSLGHPSGPAHLGYSPGHALDQLLRFLGDHDAKVAADGPSLKPSCMMVQFDRPEGR